MCVESKTKKKKKKLTGSDYLNQKTFHKQRFETAGPGAMPLNDCMHSQPLAGLQGCIHGWI